MDPRYVWSGIFHIFIVNFMIWIIKQKFLTILLKWRLIKLIAEKCSITFMSMTFVSYFDLFSKIYQTVSYNSLQFVK